MSELRKNTFEELYLQQKKKSSLLMIAVAVLAITTVGSAAWGFSKSSTSTQAPDGVATRGFNGQGGMGMGGPGMQMDITQFFNSDGSVNEDQVKTMVSRLPSGASSQFLSRFEEQIDQAVTDGKITQTQADALKKAFESAAGSSTNEQ